jgi:hypothetical protein
MDVKRLFGARARVISYLGPRPSVCKFCMEAPEELKEVYRIAVPVFQTTWSHHGNVIDRKQVATLVRDTAAKWRWRGKIVLRRWPDGRQEWACSFCGHVVNGETEREGQNN